MRRTYGSHFFPLQLLMGVMLGGGSACQTDRWVDIQTDIWIHRYRYIDILYKSEPSFSLQLLMGVMLGGGSACQING